MANTTADKLAKLEATKSALKSAINGSGSTVGDKFADYPSAVTNGRAGIAAAITEKGVQTPANAPFDVLEANVRAIETGTIGATEFVATYSYKVGRDTVFVNVFEEINGRKNAFLHFSSLYVPKKGSSGDVLIETSSAGQGYLVSNVNASTDITFTQGGGT